VFFCYNSKDFDQVKLFHKELESCGVKVWWDQNIGAGDDWTKTLEEKLGISNRVAIFYGANGVSEAQRLEINSVSMNPECKKIPIVLPGAGAVSIQGFVSLKQYIDFNQPDSDPAPMTRLIQAIKGS
jgi:TIR domain